MIKKVNTPFTVSLVSTLQAGDQILLSGVIYTARDAAHKRFIEALANGDDLPVDLRSQVLYYTGPTPSKPGDVIGSAGPTTSYRMDDYTPQLLRECGLKGMIGKGGRSQVVSDAIRQYGAVYLAALGGAGALIASCITSSEVIAYDDLGAEAVRRLVVKDLPLIVAIDKNGDSVYNRA